MTDCLPPRLMARIEAFREGKKAGRVVIDFNDGRAARWEVTEKESAREEPRREV